MFLSLSSQKFQVNNPYFTFFSEKNDEQNQFILESQTTLVKFFSSLLKSYSIWSEPSNFLWKSSQVLYSRDKSIRLKHFPMIDSNSFDFKFDSNSKVLYRSVYGFFRGRLELSNKYIIFNGVKVSDGNNAKIKESSSKTLCINITEIGFIFTRYFQHIDNSCEVYLNNWKSYLFTFASSKSRSRFFSHFKDKSFQTSDPFFASLYRACGCIYQNICSKELISKIDIVSEWQQKNISNFQYLFYLNILSSRSMNDVSQYMVFPWILSDYESESIDLKNPEIYRDLTSSMISISEEKLLMILEFYSGSDEKDQLVGSFYSTAAHVINFLIRQEPFTSMHKTLQGGSFDHANRLFYSIPLVWKSVFSSNHDFRELIPEFFCFPHFLLNTNEVDFGTLRSGEQVNHVILPPWAHSPHEFVNINALALESPFVSQRLNHWIDLTFGCYQRSMKHYNFYAPSCYRPAKIDPNEVKLLGQFAFNFGCFPDTLFSAEHPHRLLPISRRLSFISSPMVNQVVFFDQMLLIMKDGNSLDFSTNPPTKVILKFLFSSQIIIKSFAQNLYIRIDRQKNSLFKLSSKGILFRIRISNCYINCFAIVPQRILIGGSNSVIFIFQDPYYNDEPPKTITVHLYPIVSIDASIFADLIVSIDENDTVFYTSFLKLKSTHWFQIQSGSHKVKIIERGFVAISCDSDLFIYDMLGNICFKASHESQIEKIEVASEVDSDAFCILSCSDGSIFAYSLTYFSEVSYSFKIESDFFSSIPNKLSFYYIPKGENRVLESTIALPV